MTTLTDAELRCLREQIGMPVVVLSELTGFTVEDIASMEHGDTPVSPQMVDKMMQIQSITSEYIDQLILESKARGYVLTARFNAEMVGLVSEYSHFGSMWHRACAMEAQAETGLPIRYFPKKAKVRIA